MPGLPLAFDRGSLRLQAPATTRVPPYFVWDARVDAWRTAALHHMRVCEDAAAYRLELDDHAARSGDAARVATLYAAALVRLGDWHLSAAIALRKGWRPLTFTLAASDGLGATRAGPPEFDSTVEETLARTFGPRREGWECRREGAVLDIGGSLLVPDFVFRHRDGTEVVVEIAGYWTPEYIADKLRRLGRVRGVHLVVAVPRRLALRAGELPAAVLPFRRRVRLEDLLPRLEAFGTGKRTKRRRR